MPKPNYQIPTKLTFYPSHLQYYYAIGLLKSVYLKQGDDALVSTPEQARQEDLFKLATLDPSNYTTFEGGINSRIVFDFGSAGDHLKMLDFGMILGHNFGKQEASWRPYAFNNNEPLTFINNMGIVNHHSDMYTYCQYNGFSVFSLSVGAGYSSQIGIEQTDLQWSANAQDTRIGSIVFGKKWEAPHNVDISNSIKFNYGAKQIKTKAGKTISKMRYYKPNTWVGGLDAWQLTNADEIDDQLPIDSLTGRNGIREWKVKLSFLADSKVLPQNMMPNSYGWKQDSDQEYEMHPNQIDSLYTSNDGIDFYTSVLKVTMGSHLPIVIKISESNNPDQWAIVRIKRYNIRQRNPKFLDVSLTLEEQV